MEARAEREAADLACVFVHEDLDGTDGTRYAADRARVQKALSRAFGSTHYVLAIEEIEAMPANAVGTISLSRGSHGENASPL